MKNKRTWIIRAYCFLVGFYLLYLPNLSIFIPGLKASVIVMGLSLFHFLLLGGAIISYIRYTKLFALVNSYILAAIYLLVIIFLMDGQFNAVISNITALGQIVNFCAIAILLRSTGMNYRQMISFLIHLGVVQAAIAVFMLISPTAKEFANYLYLTPLGEGHILRGVVLTRVYGITTDYTYMLPSILALLAVFAFCYAYTFKSIRYAGYCILLLLATILNGRTGAYVFAGTICLFTVYFLVKKYYAVRLFSFAVITGISAVLISFVMFYFMSDKMQWVVDGFQDVFSVIGDGEHTGNMNPLVGRMLFVPEGIGLLIGEGHRVFGEYGDLTVGASSDIGYINDLFKGGILYYIIFYVPLFWFIIRQLKCERKDMENVFIHLCFAGSFIMILFVNYKGECMTGSGLIMCVIFLYMCVSDIRNTERSLIKERMK